MIGVGQLTPSTKEEILREALIRNDKKRRCSLKTCRTKLVDGVQVLALMDGNKVKAYLCSDVCLKKFNIDKTRNT